MGGRSRERGPSLFGRRKGPIPNKIFPRRMPDPNEAFAGGAMFRAAGSGVSPGRIRSSVPQEPLRHSSCSRMNNFFLPPAPIPAPPGPRLKKAKKRPEIQILRAVRHPSLSSAILSQGGSGVWENGRYGISPSILLPVCSKGWWPGKDPPAAFPCLQPLLQGSLGMQIFPSCNPRLQPACSKARLAKTSPPTIPESPRRPGLTI